MLKIWLDYWGLTEIFRAIGFLFWGLMLLALFLAAYLPSKKRYKLLCFSVVLAFVIAFPVRKTVGVQEEIKESNNTYLNLEAEFNHLCKTKAGEKIYKTVENVDGILLMKIRPRKTNNDMADLMWEGAAFVNDAGGEEYIKNFLWYEHGRESGISPVKHHKITKDIRGIIGPPLKDDGRGKEYNKSGYKYVDAIDEKDGLRYRYTLKYKIVGQKDLNAPIVKKRMAEESNYDKNIYEWVLEKKIAPNPIPKYGVTFEDYVVQEERVKGFGSSTVKVYDLQTKELMGELTLYAWRALEPTRVHNETPWLNADICPNIGHKITRKFIDQFIIPTQD